MIKTKKIILFLIICIMTVSIVSATEINMTENTDNNIQKQTTQEIQDNTNNQAQNTKLLNTSIKNNPKEVKKDLESKTIILNSTNFNEYITDTMFNEKVNPGDTIDIQGFLDGNFPITVNKAVNITSTTNNAYIGHDQRYMNTYEDYILNFIINNNGSGTNMSNIKFYNVHILLINTHNITINNISASCDKSVGSGTGMISIREGSSHVTINNSYFETKNNQGHSNVVFCFAHDCLFENNTVVGHGYIGNLVYLTTYGGTDSTGQINQTYGNSNITLRNNIIDGMDVDPQSPICVGLVYEGANHTIVNNSILRGSRTIMLQYNDYGTNVANITFEDNYIPYPGRDYITDKDINNYGTLIDGIYTLSNETSNKAFIINASNISTVINNYGSRIYALSSNIHTYIANYINDQTYKIENLYAPNTTVIINRPLNITNSIIKQLIVNTSANITNNTIINKLNNTIISNNPLNDTLIKDNYLICYNKDNIIYGDDTINLMNGIITNNGPNLEGINYLTNENYHTLFNEDNTLKENINGTIVALENITNPIIINKAITLITAPNINTNYSIVNNLHSHSGKNPPEDFLGQYIYCHTFDAEYYKINGPLYAYSNITFINGSENSNITNIIAQNIEINTNNITIENSSLYGKIILNNSNNTNMINNTLFGHNSSVTLINSNKNTLKENTIENNEEYTIKLDETSTKNMIENNHLISEFQMTDSQFHNQTTVKKGIDSIQYIQNNTIQNNSPYRNVTITIYTDDDVVYKSENNVTVNITYNNQPVTEGQVIGFFNGIEIFKENLTNGTITFTFTPQTISPSDIKIWYINQGNIYNTIGTYKNVNVRTFNTSLTIESDAVKIGENISIKATLLDEFNRPLDNKTIIFKIGEEEYSLTTKEGISTLNSTTNETWFSKGIQATFYPNESYNQSISNKITLEKGEVLLNIKQKITDENLIITVNVTDINGILVNNGRIRFRGENISTSPKITNGSVTLELPISTITEGKTVTVNFTNNNAFNEKAENITLTLNPPTITNTKIEPINGKTNEETTITATITTENNTPINQGQVTFTTTDLNETTNVNNGIATITHTFTQPLNNTITATYTPTDNTTYYESTNTTTITITKNPENTTITLTPITGKTNQETTITATITTEDNQPINQGTITFTTTDYTETVQVTNGTATITHTFTQTLNDTITATYTPENPEDYNPQTKITTITITEENKELTLKIDTKTFIINQNNTITARIYQGENIQNNITGGKIVFKVNGKSLKDTNGKVIYAKVVNGTATIENYTVPPTWNKENTTITAVYSGYKEYTPLRSQEEQITLTTPTPTLTITPITDNIQTGSTIKLQAKITNDNTPITTGKIIFKLNGKTLKDANGKVIYAQVDANGTVSFDYNIGNLKVNTYKLTATFIANGYDKLEANTTINVVKA